MSISFGESNNGVKRVPIQEKERMYITKLYIYSTGDYNRCFRVCSGRKSQHSTLNKLSLQVFRKWLIPGFSETNNENPKPFICGVEKRITRKAHNLETLVRIQSPQQKKLLLRILGRCELISTIELITGMVAIT